MEQYANPKPFSFTLKHAWLVIGLYLATIFIVAIPIAVVQLSLTSAGCNPDVFKGWLMLATNIAVYAILFFVLYQFFKQKCSGQALLELSRVNISTYLLLAVLILSLSISIEPIVNLLAGIPMPKLMEDVMAMMTKATVPFFILAVIIAPLCEELMMRGTILRGLLTSNKPVTAILWTAFLFALIHMNLPQGFAAFTIGMVLGWVYWKTRSLWACIFVHFVNNAFAFTGIAIAGPENAATATFPSLTGFPPVLVYSISLALLASSGYLLWRRYEKQSSNFVSQIR